MKTKKTPERIISPRSALNTADNSSLSLGDHLVANGKITRSALERAERLSRESGDNLQTVIPRLGLATERDLTDALATMLNLPIAQAADYPAEPALEERFSRSFLKESRLIPLEDRGEGLAVAVVDPLDSYACDAARFAAKKPILRYLAYPSDFEAAYERLYGDGRSEIREIVEAAPVRDDMRIDDDIQRLEDSASEAPVIRLVNLLITKAVEQRASDIHIEPMEGELRVRYRIDGVLHDGEAPPARLASAIISRVKIMAKLNIAERRLPQDGRIKLAVRGRDIDVRVSTTPTIHGESVVLRILDRTNLSLTFDALGIDDASVTALRAALRRPYGIVLVTGPTGSGKTTTLYAALSELNSADKKVLTIEDPVEYQIKGINQVQVRPQIGHSFANALRSFLRQDPDIMMVGEIRDLETAQVAVQSALTGHLILSTLHTNNAASAVTRLLDMGVEPFLVISTVSAIAAQRLVRMLCEHCKEPYQASTGLLESLDLRSSHDTLLYRIKGCARCNGTGYRGRTAIMEVLAMSEPLRDLVLARASAGAIQECAIAAGMQTMFACGLSKALSGVTSVEEVIRVARLD